MKTQKKVNLLKIDITIFFELKLMTFYQKFDTIGLGDLREEENLCSKPYLFFN